MKRHFTNPNPTKLSGLIFMAVSVITSFILSSCGKESQPDTQQTVTAEEEPFKIKVYDISTVSATVEVEPLDKKAAYFTDVINEADFLQATQNGFDDYMAWFIEKMENQTGKSRKEVIGMISSYDNDGFILTTLTPQTKYYAFAVGIDADGKTTTKAVSTPFTTAEVLRSDNTFSISIPEKSTDKASVKVTVSEDDPYIISIEPSSISGSMTDSDLASYIIQSNMAWGGLEAMTYQGDADVEHDGKAGWEYEVVVFGYADGTATTDVERMKFRMDEGGDPAGCAFDFSYSISNFNVNLNVIPDDPSVVYVCNIIKKKELDALISETGSMEDALVKNLKTMIEGLVAECGTKERAIDLITVMGPTDYSIGFTPSTEYMQWAVPMSQSGEIQGGFSCSDVFMTPAEITSSASLTLKEFAYYNGTELAEMYPEMFNSAKGYAVVDMTVEPSEDAVTWWSYVALEDLTDRSRSVIIRNLTMAPTEPCLTRQLVVAFWGVNTIMGVAQDAQGEYGPLMLQVADLQKESAAPASELQLP